MKEKVVFVEDELNGNTKEVKKSKKKQKFPTDDEIETYGEKNTKFRKTETKKSSTHEAKKKKKLNQYSNVKTANQ